ncbi:MAG: hypothetical protein LBF59_03315 [Prevotellaceae bacterium]|nr:hypothetical protein [Prevotellaceae bacterium]
MPHFRLTAILRQCLCGSQSIQNEAICYGFHGYRLCTEASRNQIELLELDKLAT